MGGFSAPWEGCPHRTPELLREGQTGKPEQSGCRYERGEPGSSASPLRPEARVPGLGPAAPSERDSTSPLAAPPTSRTKPGSASRDPQLTGSLAAYGLRRQQQADTCGERTARGLTPASTALGARARGRGGARTHRGRGPGSRMPTWLVVKGLGPGRDGECNRDPCVPTPTAPARACGVPRTAPALLGNRGTAKERASPERPLPRSSWPLL